MKARVSRIEIWVKREDDIEELWKTIYINEPIVKVTLDCSWRLWHQ